MEFQLTITLGNEAMEDAYDVSRALRRVADRLVQPGPASPGDSAAILDDNGNKVGRWELA